MERSSTLEITNELSEIYLINARLELIAEEWEIPSKTIGTFTLVLEELVTNIINYGYDKGHHVILLAFSLEHDALTIQLIDDGKPFNPLDAPEPDINAPAEERRIGGLGIYFANKLMDSLTYERKDDKNHLTITKKIFDPES